MGKWPRKSPRGGSARIGAWRALRANPPARLLLLLGVVLILSLVNQMYSPEQILAASDIVTGEPAEHGPASRPPTWSPSSSADLFL